MKQAGGRGARFAVILGDDEVAAGAVTLRDLAASDRGAPAPYRSQSRRIVAAGEGRMSYRTQWCGRDHGGPGGTACRRRRMGAPPAGPRRSGVHRPARPHGTRPAGVRSGGRRRRAGGRPRAAQRVRAVGPGDRRRPLGRDRSIPPLPTGAIEIAIDGLTVLAKAQDAALLPRRPNRGRRDPAPALPLSSTFAGSGCSATSCCATAPSKPCAAFWATKASSRSRHPS